MEERALWKGVSICVREDGRDGINKRKLREVNLSIHLPLRGDRVRRLPSTALTRGPGLALVLARSRKKESDQPRRKVDLGVIIVKMMKIVMIMNEQLVSEYASKTINN